MLDQPGGVLPAVGKAVGLIAPVPVQPLGGAAVPTADMRPVVDRALEIANVFVETPVTSLAADNKHVNLNYILADDQVPRQRRVASLIEAAVLHV